MSPVRLPFLQPGRPALAAMIHVGALPGTPRSERSVANIAAQCADEARLLAEAGVDAILIENMHDLPYVRPPAGPHIVAAMAAVGLAVRKAAPDTTLGVQVLAGANREALAVAQACGATFVRAEGFVFAHVGDEGVHDACAGELLRYRREIGADDIAVITDIKKKHSAHAVTADVSLVETAQAAEFFLADGVIVTGAATGAEASPEELDAVKAAVSVPVCVGSGITPANAQAFASADVLIAGSWFKRDGLWSNPPDRERVERLVGAVRSISRRGGNG